MPPTTHGRVLSSGGAGLYSWPAPFSEPVVAAMVDDVRQGELVQGLACLLDPPTLPTANRGRSGHAVPTRPRRHHAGARPCFWPPRSSFTGATAPQQESKLLEGGIRFSICRLPIVSCPGISEFAYFRVCLCLMMTSSIKYYCSFLLIQVHCTRFMVPDLRKQYSTFVPSSSCPTPVQLVASC